MNRGLDVLILTASYGAGHNSAASAIREQILSCDNSLKVVIIDMFEITNPYSSQVMYKAYKYIMTRYPNAFNHSYYLKKEHSYTFTDKLTYIVSSGKFNEYYFRIKPSIIVSTYPFCSLMVSRFKEKYNQKVPLVTCITDVADSIEWVQGNTDLYFAPIEEIKMNLMLRGVEKQKIKVTGIPVKKEFLMMNSKKTNGNLGRLNILIMGGGLGLLELDDDFLCWLDSIENISAEIVTGLNERLYSRLTKTNKYKNIKIYEFIQNVATHMEKADILISKPGGVTIFEALHIGLPIVVISSHIGQEIENSKFITKYGVGCIKNNQKDVQRFLESSLENRAELVKITASMEKIKSNLEASKLGSYILKLL